VLADRLTGSPLGNTGTDLNTALGNLFGFAPAGRDLANPGIPESVDGNIRT
jgi:hypothetical protein